MYKTVMFHVHVDGALITKWYILVNMSAPPIDRDWLSPEFWIHLAFESTWLFAITQTYYLIKCCQQKLKQTEIKEAQLCVHRLSLLMEKKDTHWQTTDYLNTLVYISKILQDTPTFTSYGIEGLKLIDSTVNGCLPGN